MGTPYTVTTEDVTTSVAVDLVELTPADDRPIRVVGYEISQNTELGDAAEEQIRLEWIVGHTTSGSGGSAPTPRPTNPRSVAAGFTAEMNNTTQATVGSTVIHSAFTWNVRQNAKEWYPPGCGPRVDQANTTLILRLMAAPADALDVSCTIYVEVV